MSNGNSVFIRALRSKFFGDIWLFVWVKNEFISMPPGPIPGIWVDYSSIPPFSPVFCLLTLAYTYTEGWITCKAD